MNALSQTSLIQEVVLCCCSWTMFHSVLDTWHVSSWVSLMNGQQESLVKTQQNKNLLKPARKTKEVICALSLHLFERGKRQLLASCWRFMSYVDWYVISVWFTGVVDDEGVGFFFGVKQQSIFYNLICLDCPYLYQYLYKDLENKGFFFSSGASFMSPF